MDLAGRRRLAKLFKRSQVSRHRLPVSQFDGVIIALGDQEIEHADTWVEIVGDG